MASKGTMARSAEMAKERAKKKAAAPKAAPKKKAAPKTSESYEDWMKEEVKFNESFRGMFGLKNGGKVMMNKTMAYKKGGKVFKPCAGCPSPAKCKKAGKCLAKAAPKKKMKSGGCVSKKK